MVTDTSKEAYRNIQESIGERQLEILNAIRKISTVQDDCTDTEVMTYLRKQDPNYVRPRRNELVNKFKLVGFSRNRKCLATGATCMAWKPLRIK